jgi:hypothetical protein
MQFPFAVDERVHAGARTIRITVGPTGAVRLTIPRRVSRSEARAFLASRIDWVLAARDRAQAKSRANGPAAIRWDGSDQTLLRGVLLPLRFQPAALARPQVRFSAEAVELFGASRLHHEQRLLALRTAYVHEARLECEDMLLAQGKRMGLRFKQLRIADTRAQWGSCKRTGEISLSWRLLLAPTEVLRYVAIHELCHLVHHDHSPAFWRLVASHCPGYEAQQQWLRQHGSGLHLWLKPTLDWGDSGPNGLAD